MPIYEYACIACKHRTDIVHGINDPGPQFCPSCGIEGSMRKQFALPTIHFKGTGWAKKDRGGAGASTRAAAAGGGASKDEPGPVASDGKAPAEGSGGQGGSADGRSAGEGSTKPASEPAAPSSDNKSTGSRRGALGARDAAEGR